MPGSPRRSAHSFRGPHRAAQKGECTSRLCCKRRAVRGRELQRIAQPRGAQRPCGCVEHSYVTAPLASPPLLLAACRQTGTCDWRVEGELQPGASRHSESTPRLQPRRVVHSTSTAIPLRPCLVTQGHGALTRSCKRAGWRAAQGSWVTAPRP